MDICNKTHCNNPAELNSITGEGELCVKHALIEANDVGFEG